MSEVHVQESVRRVEIIPTHPHSLVEREKRGHNFLLVVVMVKASKGSKGDAGDLGGQ